MVDAGCRRAEIRAPIHATLRREKAGMEAWISYSSSRRPEFNHQKQIHFDLAGVDGLAETGRATQSLVESAGGVMSVSMS